jgi:hypothetical protein
VPAFFASLILLMAAIKKKPIKTGASSRHITNLKQSILEAFDIYDPDCKAEPRQKRLVYTVVQN